MDQYLVLTTTTDQPLANSACALLEEAGIPLMLEHVELSRGARRACGYRLLVPQRYSHKAQRLVFKASSAHLESLMLEQ
ncbi:MAG: DUF2007 domain-containing protein [Oligoflexia bacterium]|nr:DUF2007 domain-containing protein [Oligoflexia bacterium]